jgi:diguanylate cyclase
VLHKGELSISGGSAVMRNRYLVGGLWFAILASLLAAFVQIAAMMAVTPGLGWPDLPLAAGMVLLALLAELGIALVGRRQLYTSMAGFDDAHAARAQIEELFAMTDMLQSADGHDDACQVLRTSALRLLPDYGAALYIFNNSRDRLDLMSTWNLPQEYVAAETLSPVQCWALKRGKPHINEPASGTLVCPHHGEAVSALEVPMMARGVVYGLLVFVTTEAEAMRRLLGIRRLCRALADSMSLALSNIGLREKLRTQSMRDPLTGLYNRRYMEDALERYVSLAERTSAPTAVLMLDLDSFKRLNDEHGHAKGDVVLRDVAAQIVGALRPSDIVCRYGGEELLVILPNCTLENARQKAEMLRTRIEALSDAHNAAVSASIGVAAIPETSASLADLVPLADAALYKAKRSGKNCVVCADRKAGPDAPELELALLG